MAVFRDNEELEGVEVGSYADFGELRELVAELLEGGVAGSRFPVLMLHSDSRGSWSPDEATRLRAELHEIAAGFRTLPARDPKPGSWQQEVAKKLGIRPTNLHESVFDVDGEPLIDRLIELAEVAMREGAGVLFQ